LEKGLNEAQGKTRLNGVGDSDFGKTVVDRKVSVDDLGWPLFNEINKRIPTYYHTKDPQSTYSIGLLWVLFKDRLIKARI
jgi:hypothetical protein